MSQNSYTHPVLVNGQIASGVNRTVRSRTNELLAQISNIASAAAPGAGDYTVRLESRGEVVEATYTSPGGESQADIVDGIIAAFGDDLLNIATLVDNGNDFDINFLATGRVWTVTLLSNPGGNLTHTISQAAGGTDIPLGVGVVRGSAEDLASLPDSGSTDPDFIGITVRNTDSEVNDGSDVGVDAFKPGSVLSILTIGDGVCVCETAFVEGGNVFVRIDNPGPGQSLGGIRNDVDGGNAVQLRGARFLSTGAAGELCKYTINRPTN